MNLLLFNSGFVISYWSSGSLLPSVWVILRSLCLCKNEGCSLQGSAGSVVIWVQCKQSLGVMGACEWQQSGKPHLFLCSSVAAGRLEGRDRWVVFCWHFRSFWNTNECRTLPVGHSSASLSETIVSVEVSSCNAYAPGPILLIIRITASAIGAYT